MIGFFVNSGDEEVSEMFRPYIWSDKGIDPYIKKYIKTNSYSKDLDLLLIMFYVEGKFDINPPENGKVGNYSSKDKSVSVAIDVTRDKFHDKNEKSRKLFIADSIILAVNSVAEKMKKKKMDYDKEKLLKDLEESVFKRFLEK